MRQGKFWQSCAIVLIAVFTMTAVGCGESPAARMEKAQQYESQGAYRKAMIELKNVLKKEPDNAKARFLLGKVSLQRGDSSAAENQLDRAQKLGVEANTVLPLLANALLAQHKFDDVLKRINVDSSQKNSLQAELLAARGHAYLGLGRNDEAAAAFKKAIKTYPRTAQALIGQAQLALVNNDIKTAGAKLDDALEADPKAMSAWLIKGNIALHDGQLPLAVKDFEKAIDAPEEAVTPEEKFDARGRLAVVLMKQDKDKEALSQINNMLKQAPKHPLPNYLRALLAYRQKNYDVAVDKLQNVLSVMPNNVRAQELLGDIKAQQGDMAQAQMYLNNALSENPKDPRTVAALARVLMHQGNTDQAVAVLNNAVKQGVKDPRILGMLNNAIMASVRTAAGRNYLQQNLAAQTHNPTVQMSLAKAFLQAGKNDEAMALLQQVNTADKSADFQRNALVVMTLLRKGDKTKALAEARSLSQSQPDAPAGHNLLGGVYEALNRSDDARAEFEKAQKLAPDNMAAGLNLGLLSLHAGQYQQAVDQLQPLTQKSDNLQMTMLLARAYAGLGDTEKAIDTVRKANTAHPDAVEPRLVLIRYYIARKQPDKAQKLAQAAVDHSPDNADLINLLGLTQLAGDDTKDAMASFSKAADKAPEVSAFQLNLARAQIAAHQYDAAIETLQKIHKQQPKDLSAAFMLALTQMSAGKTDAAFATARSLRGQEGGNVGGSYLLEGDLHMSQKDYPAAVHAYSEAIDKGHVRGAVGRALTAREKAGMSDPEKPVLEWLASHPGDAEMRALLAQWYSTQDEYAKASSQYRQLVKKENGKNPIMLNNLAWVYYKQNDPRALKTARRAHKLAPDNAAVTDTLGWLELGKGDTAKGLDLLGQAVKQAPDAADVRYHFAVALAKSGDKAKAREQLDKILQGKEKFSTRPDAEKLARKLAKQ